MDKLKQKHEKLQRALISLDETINLFDLFQKEGISYNPHADYETEYRVHRDSVIQRFEYSADLFWKYLKRYLEDVSALPVIGGPKPVIRESYSSKILYEDEAEMSLEMIDDRNLTLHMYVEEIAEQLSAKIPKYYVLMQNVANRLMPQ